MEASASPTVVKPLEDEALRTLPAGQLAARINSISGSLDRYVEIAVAAASVAVHTAIALGQVLDEARRRYEGEFAEWLESVVERDEAGNSKMSLATALRYRTLWAKRDLIFPPDGSQPPPRNLTEAYRKAGLLPEEVPGEKDDAGPRPVFRLAFTAPAVPAGQWPPAERRAFLTQAEPIVRLYQELQEVGT